MKSKTISGEYQLAKPIVIRSQLDGFPPDVISACRDFLECAKALTENKKVISFMDGVATANEAKEIYFGSDAVLRYLDNAIVPITSLPLERMLSLAVANNADQIGDAVMQLALSNNRLKRILKQHTAHILAANEYSILQLRVEKFVEVLDRLEAGEEV